MNEHAYLKHSKVHEKNKVRWAMHGVMSSSSPNSTIEHSPQISHGHTNTTKLSKND